MTRGVTLGDLIDSLGQCAQSASMVDRPVRIFIQMDVVLAARNVGNETISSLQNRRVRLPDAATQPNDTQLLSLTFQEGRLTTAAIG